MEDRETARTRKYVESKTTRIMMATVPHVTSGLGLIKFQADGFLLTRVYNKSPFHCCKTLSRTISTSRDHPSSWRRESNTILCFEAKPDKLGSKRHATLDNHLRPTYELWG